MEILFNDSIPITAWQEFLSRNAHATPFQSPGFYKLFNSVKSLSAQAVAVLDSGSLKALAVITFQQEPGIKGFFSRRAIVYGGPLIDDPYPEAIGKLLEEISNTIGGRAIYSEIRNFSAYSISKDIFINYGYTHIPYLNFRVSTGKMEAILKGISSSRLRQIKKANRNSVTWKEAQNIYEVKLFYDILSNLYKNKIAKPLLPFGFFRNFFESGLGKYLLVWYESKIIGGIMCPIMDGKAIYEFYVCGLDNEYKEQYPSVMATWAAMEYATQNNIPVFDFMGAGKPDEHYGVREFKARFGGDLVNYGRFLRINKPIMYRIGKKALRISKSISR
ncbi:MAG: peptidoglycan bridge formation glycyltransferase FemA/FemB family protein [Bacteroidales bacterium]|nr:peptidoglycan bridge formation glycyltransferase FemA/FemB family protein [Bacteroidales bacterium]